MVKNPMVKEIEEQTLKNKILRPMTGYYTNREINNFDLQVDLYSQEFHCTK